MNPRKPKGYTIARARRRGPDLTNEQCERVRAWMVDRQNAGGAKAMRASDRLAHRFSSRLIAILEKNPVAMQSRRPPAVLWQAFTPLVSKPFLRFQ